MDWNPFNIFERSNGDEVVSQADASYFIIYGALTCLAASLIASCVSIPRTKEWKHSFCTSFLLALTVIQMVYVARVATMLTPELETSVIYSNCRYSSKGGKLSGSYRDCTESQVEFCTKEKPCTPCDYPIPYYNFDGTMWNMDCEICSSSYQGKCNFDSRQGPFCKQPDGSVSPCSTCCLSKHVGNQEMNTLLSVNNCERVYDSKFFTWDDDGTLDCSNSEYPVKTAFGCCPLHSERPEFEELVRSMQTNDDKTQYIPTCLTRGPFNASWSFCLQDPTLNIHGTNVSSLEMLNLSEQSCPVYSNGVYQDSYCQKPILVNDTTTT